MCMYKMRFHKRWTSKFFSKYEDPEFPFWECYWGLICKELKSYKSSLVYTCPEPNATGALLTGECCYTRILNSIWSPRMCGKAHGSTKITKVVLEKEKKKEKKKFQAEHKLKLLCFIASATTKKQAKEAVKLRSELRIWVLYWGSGTFCSVFTPQLIPINDQYLLSYQHEPDTLSGSLHHVILMYDNQLIYKWVINSTRW